MSIETRVSDTAITIAYQQIDDNSGMWSSARHEAYPWLKPTELAAVEARFVGLDQRDDRREVKYLVKAVVYYECDNLDDVRTVLHGGILPGQGDEVAVTAPPPLTGTFVAFTATGDPVNPTVTVWGPFTEEQAISLRQDGWFTAKMQQMANP